MEKINITILPFLAANVFVVMIVTFFRPFQCSSHHCSSKGVILAFEQLSLRGIHFAVFAHIVGWVKRDVGTTYVGFAYFNAPQKFEIETT